MSNAGTVQQTGDPAPVAGQQTPGRQTNHMGSGWLWLTIPIAVLGAIAAGVGAFVDDFYELDTESFGVQAASQDYVTLFVAVPAVLLLGWLAYRGALSARLMWHGVVFYFAYTYAIAAFMVRFNELFLVYTSLLACSLFALVGGMATLGWPIVESRFGRRWPRRSTAVFLWFVVATFLMLWLSDIVPALLDGVQPESLAESDTPTNGVEVLDLALLLPAAALTGVWVWRAQARGYVFATCLLSYIVVLGLALGAMVVGLAAADLDADPAVSVAFIIVSTVAAILLAAIVRSHRTAQARKAGSG